MLTVPFRNGKNETLEILSKISLKLSDSIHLRRWCCTEHYDLKLNDWYTSWSGCTDRSAQYCIITFILQLMRIASVVQWTQRNYPTSIFESKKKRKENKRSIQSCGRRKFYQLKNTWAVQPEKVSNVYEKYHMWLRFPVTTFISTIVEYYVNVSFRFCTVIVNQILRKIFWQHMTKFL